MPWISDETLKLYREMNASQLVVAEAMRIMAMDVRRIEKRLDQMAKSNSELLSEVRETRGFVASIKGLIEGLRKQVADALASHDADEELSNEVDSLFQEAKAAAGDAAPAIVANPTPADPVPPSPGTPQADSPTTNADPQTR